MIEVLFFVVLAICWGACLWLFFQNTRVRNIRLAKLKEISAAADFDIQEGREWRWRYDDFDVPNYNQMMWQLKPRWQRDPARAEQ